MTNRLFRFLTLPTLSLALASSSQAQPDVESAPKAENPVNREPRGLRRGIDQRRMLRDDPQERTRRFFRPLGVTDTKQQDALTAYIEGEAAAREAMIEKGRSLAATLRTPTLTDVQTVGLLNTYNAALEDHKVRRETALTKLKQSVDLTRYPKVETYLTLLGFYGEGPSVMTSSIMRRREMRGGIRLAPPKAANGAAGGVGAPTTPRVAPKTPVAPAARA